MLNKFTLAFAFALVLLVICTTAAQAATTVYNNIPATIPLSTFSQGAEAYAFTELGDGFTLAHAGGTLNTISVVLSSWACQSGSWSGGPSSGNACVTSNPNTTYQMPMTVNVYAVTTGTSWQGVSEPSPGTLLATATQMFFMPYRPSSDFDHCPATAAQSSGGYYQWYNAATQTCQDGIDFAISFDLSSQNVTLPAQVIVTFSYNTTDYGPMPIGTGAACYGTPAGCFYDSLNITGGANEDAFPGPIPAPTVGSLINIKGIYVRFPNPSSVACGKPHLPANSLAMDGSQGCYTGNHPMITVTTK